MPKRPRPRKRSNVVETSSDSESEEFTDQLQGNEEALWDFLYDLKGIENVDEDEDDERRPVDNFEAYFEMFNAPFVLGDVLDQCRDYLTKEHASFEMLVANERVKVEGVHFVHVQSVGGKNSSARRAINRITSFLPEGDSIMLSACPYHAKGDCKLVEENVAFVCYLQSFGIGLTLQEDMEVKRVQVEKHAAIFTNDLSIQALPSLHINGKEYLFFHDIRILLDLTEDYALAILAQCKVQDPILGCLQTTCGPQQELLLCYDEARHEKNLPTEEKFLEVQASIPYSRLLSEESDEDTPMPKGTMRKKPSKSLSERGSKPAAYMGEEPNNKKVSKGVKQLIDPWMDECWIYDENFQLALDMDEFFRRGSQSKRERLGKDSSLIRSLKGLVSKGVLLFHSRLSNHSYFPIFVLKTLSRFLGGHRISSSANKVILVEKQVAIDVFGYASKSMSCRAGYFLSYAAHALTFGIKDPIEGTPTG